MRISAGLLCCFIIADLPKLKLSLDMRDMLRVFTEEALSEFFYYQEGSAWKYDLK